MNIYSPQSLNSPFLTLYEYRVEPKHKLRVSVLPSVFNPYKDHSETGLGETARSRVFDV